MDNSKDDRVRQIISENMCRTAMTPLVQNIALGEEAKAYLHVLATQQDIVCDATLTEKVLPQTGYSMNDLHDIFDT